MIDDGGAATEDCGKVPNVGPGMITGQPDIKGDRSVEADLVNVEGEIVVLKRADGNLIRVPLAELGRCFEQAIPRRLAEAGPPPQH